MRRGEAWFMVGLASRSRVMHLSNHFTIQAAGGSRFLQRWRRRPFGPGFAVYGSRRPRCYSELQWISSAADPQVLISRRKKIVFTMNREASRKSNDHWGGVPRKYANV